jgi:hypothetical protein
MGGENSYSCGGEGALTYSGDWGTSGASDTGVLSLTFCSSSNCRTLSNMAERGRASSTGALAPKNTSFSADSFEPSRGMPGSVLLKSRGFLVSPTFDRCRLLSDLGDDIEGAGDCIGECSSGSDWKVTTGAR